MNPQRLLQHFDTISEAPDAVPKLRKLILDLAVRGKLVEQDVGDEPASNLLDRIRSRSTGSGASTKQELVLNSDAAPFHLPSGWRWVRLGHLADFSAGRTPSRHDSSYWSPGAYPWISIRDMVDGGTVTVTKEAVSEKAKSVIFPGEPLPVGTMIMSFKLTIGKMSLLGVPAFHNEAIISIRPRIEAMSTYLFRVLPKFSRQGNAKAAIKGATLNRSSLEQILLPVPPLAEQHRIVAKVDELMALCDQLQSARDAREQQRDRLVAASLQRLTARGPNDTLDSSAAAVCCADHSRFHLQSLSRLSTRNEHIKQLRQAVLNLAIGGRLLAQDEGDEPAVNALERVQQERSYLVSAGEVRRTKPLAKVRESGYPFHVPTSWRWARIGDATLFTDYGTSEKSYSLEGGVPVLKMGDIQEGSLVLGRQKSVPKTIAALPTLYLKNLDLLYNRTNSAELVGKTGLYRGSDDEYTFASYLIRIRCAREGVDPNYLNMAMNSTVFRTTQIVPHLKQQCGQANVNGTILKNMVVPIPPLAEQHRIVAKVDALMALCDQLEASLASAQADRTRLLDALLHEALAPAVDHKDHEGEGRADNRAPGAAALAAALH